MSTHSRPVRSIAEPAFRKRLRGQVTGPADADYDTLRRVFNGMFDRRPALIVRPIDEQDVRAAVLLAREHDLDIAVRCGGHSAPGFGTCDGGVVIDMRAIASAHVDPQRRMARVGGGMDWGALDAATQEHGLAVTGGRVSSTGVAGFTLGSGSGWLERVMGFAADSLISARVVSAEGSIVTASRDENPDLFWALRGGGGNFGVVVEFEFALRAIGPTILGGSRFYGIDAAAQVIGAFRDVMEQAPDEVCGGLTFITAPTAPFVPESLRGQPALAHMLLWAGDLVDAEKGLACFDELGAPAVDLVDAKPYTAVQRTLDAFAGPGMRNYYTSGLMRQMPEAAIETFVQVARAKPSPTSHIILYRLGGAFARMPDDETAISHRDAPWMYQVLSSWLEPDADEVNRAWARGGRDELNQHSEAMSFANFVADEGDASLRVAYGDAKLSRLAAVKRAWDPDNVFHLNHNIKPALASASLA
ncbi:MAG: FAD-binding oxidoreductase [Solirubrobacterales bacterium]|nr:FAD-binding oxidoreductase [Solirubrobacterales bacterium]